MSKPQKNKMNLKRKTNIHTKVLNDQELADAVAEITIKYQNYNFRDIVDALDNDYRELFKHSKYEYMGLSTELGILGDVKLLFKPKVSK